jgi:serine/threonine protein kinase
MPETKPLLPGDPESIGAYRLTGRLGEGGQGVVFMGSGPAGENVAVKLLQANLDAGARQRFVRELESTKKVARFCTAQVLDADVFGDRPFIVSEYVPGPSLSAAVAADGVLSGGSLERLAIGTLTALVAIHQAGVIHRDFKPHNVILGSDGPRVIDFGIAKALDASSTQASGVIGTPAYMAPEQIEGKQVGTQADIFSWGLTMAFAANGRPPFGTDTITAIIGRILHGTADLGTMTGPVRDLVLDALAKDPLRRPSAKDLLLQLLGGAPAQTQQQTSEPQAALLEMGEDRAGLSTDPRHAWNVPGTQTPPPQPYSAYQAAPTARQTPPPQAYGEYQQQPAAYGQGPAYGQTTQGGQYPPVQAGPPRRSGGRGMAIALTALVAVLLLVGGTVLALNKVGDKTTAKNTGSPYSTPSDSLSPSTEPSVTDSAPSQTASSAPQTHKPTVGSLSCTDTGTDTLGDGVAKSGVGLNASGGTVSWTAKLSGPGSLSASNGTLASGAHGYVSLTLSSEQRAVAGTSTISVTGASGGSCTRQVTWSAAPVVEPTTPTVAPTASDSAPAGDSGDGGGGYGKTP